MSNDGGGSEEQLLKAAKEFSVNEVVVSGKTRSVQN